MLRPSDRAASKSGTSRYSKALPGVPGSDDYDEFVDDDDDDTTDNKTAGRISGSKSSDPPHSRTNSAFSHPARTSSLASPPPPPKDLPLPPLPLKLQQKLGDSDESNKSSAHNSVESPIRQVAVAAPSPVSSVTTSAPSLQSPPLTGRSMMAIPRKPIANLNLQPPSAEFLGQPSPTFSLSSILMAYMEDGDEPQAESQGITGTGTGTGAGSERPAAAPASAPSVSVRGSSASLPARPNAGKDRNTRPADRNTAPPPPLKDRQPLQKTPAATPTATPTPTPAPAPAASPEKPLPSIDTSELASPSSPRPEIWKRRPHMTQGSREVSGLRLDSSHGSTADTQPSSDASFSRAAPEPTVSTDRAAAQRAPPFAGGLPGRNVRPSLRLKDRPVIDAAAMGNESSKMKQIKDKLAHQRSDSVLSNTAGAKTGLPSAPVAKRPPTPEYQKEEVKEPAVEPFVSPVSPASSPEAPRGASPDFTKGLPPKPSNGGQLVTLPSGPRPIVRKALPSQPSQDLTAAKNAFRQQPNATSVGASSSQASAVSVPPKDDAVPVAGPTAAPAPVAPLKDAATVRLVTSRDAPAMQAQPARERTDSLQTVKPQRSMPQSISEPRMPQSDAQGPTYRGRDGTVYAEMKTGGEPNPKAAYFPKPALPGLMRDGIAKARPLSDAHFNCFQRHRSMARRSNKNCPLTCQTCDRADLEDRWVCAFCHLRICDSCHRRLDGYQRDLRRFVDVLAAAGTLAGTSSSRPGTSLGA
ncbi:hypothetical protein BBK36DRAFT_1116435 [Trichoderma citrinoviride]|uniref:Uncharacterized protein n=1 Tax=Trichoderma citrinoviride TaxID=58853 RepID=A0A2T4BDR5_9HYPO|nr:hypothetical protein BBK36DRAFT_1116435 [Trichoderma citrinoviride]PTB67455.1 hypothetical protein BBK36DRAFT_1116435 [Trichoderma citrinoviride]